MGIRGVGSVFYLMVLIRFGVTVALGSFTLATVAASIVIHSASVQPLMKWYVRHKLMTP